MSAVEQHHVLTYQTSVQMVAQQMRNPLEDFVTQIECKGEAYRFARLLNAGEYAYGEDRSRRNVELPATGASRWLVRPPELLSGQYIDIEDKLDMALDPTSDFVTDHTKRVIRGRFDRIMGIRKQGSTFVVADGGILGGVREGKSPGAMTPLPASQTIPVAGTGLTLDKLMDAMLKLNEADFGLEDDDPLVCVIGPRQKRDLLAIAAASATPLNAFEIQQIKDGKPTSLMGITWVFTNRLPKVGNTRYCPVFSKSNIVVGNWVPLSSDIWPDYGANKLPYCKVWTRLDVGRKQDKGVIVIECNEP